MLRLVLATLGILALVPSACELPAADGYEVITLVAE